MSSPDAKDWQSLKRLGSYLLKRERESNKLFLLSVMPRILVSLGRLGLGRLPKNEEINERRCRNVWKS